ncbi:MAG: TetR/AcrR family transcriptional regulator [Betaproteobacteria bacterium]
MAGELVRERILDRAERLFAQRGYHGTSLREVARACGMRQSHVQYHYGSKESLFRAVFERRVLPMNRLRLERLAAAEVRGGRPDARAVVRALVEPIVLLSRQGRGGAKLYPQLVAQILNDPQAHARRISREFNDPVARAAIASLKRAVPQISQGDLAWCYVFAVGAMVSAVSGTGRVGQLSGGRADPDDVNRILALLVPFVAGGLRAAAAEGRRRRPAGARKA